MAFILQAAGTASINPVIYGIADKTIHPFGKCCFKGKQIWKILHKNWPGLKNKLSLLNIGLTRAFVDHTWLQTTWTIIT